MHESPPQREGCDVHLDRYTIEPDRSFDRCSRHRDVAELIRHANNQQVGRWLRCEDEASNGFGVDVPIGIALGRRVDRTPETLRFWERFVFEAGHHLARGDLRCRHESDRGLGVGTLQHLRLRTADHVEQQQRVGVSSADLGSPGVALLTDPKIRNDLPTLLRQAGLVEARGNEAIEHRCGRQHLRHGHNARAADPDDQQRRLLHSFGFGWCIAHAVGRAGGVGNDRVVGVDLDGHEGRAISAQTTQVEVAGLLVNLRFAPKGRLDRVHAHAVRHLAAMTAAFADRLVDHHSGRWGLQGASLATAPEIGCASLVVDQGSHTGNISELPLHGIEFSPVDHPTTGSEVRVRVVLVDIVGNHDGRHHALGVEPASQLGHRHLTGGVLTAGHGYDAVVEQLERDVGVGCDRLTYRERTTVEEGSIAQVLKPMRVAHERRGANPLRPFATHLREPDG